KVMFAVVTVPSMRSVPALLMSMEPPDTAEATLLTSSVTPFPDCQEMVPAVAPLPRVMFPYARAGEPLSKVQELTMTKSWPASGTALALHFVVSLKFPGPVKVTAARLVVVVTEEKGDEPLSGVVQLPSE